MLWKKVMPRLSAGRVQSVATRLVVERERERIAFRVGRVLGHRGHLRSDRPEGGRPRHVHRHLVAARRRRIATGPRLRSGDRLSSASRPASRRGRAPAASPRAWPAAVRGLAGRREAVPPPAVRAVHDLDAAAGGRPQAPLLGRARRCGSPSGCTRTASSPICAPTRPPCRETAINAARAQARELYGDEYVPAEPRVYTRKVKNAQEAHEAIRPAGDPFRTPGEVASQLARTSSGSTS